MLIQWRKAPAWFLSAEAMLARGPLRDISKVAIAKCRWSIQLYRQTKRWLCLRSGQHLVDQLAGVVLGVIVQQFKMARHAAINARGD